MGEGYVTDKRGAQRQRDRANSCADDRLNGELPGTSPVAVLCL